MDGLLSNQWIDHNNIVGELYVYMIKFKIRSVVLCIYQSQESKILDQKRTLNIKKSCQIKRRQKSVPCQASTLLHEKITNLYPHSAGVDIFA